MYVLLWWWRAIYIIIIIVDTTLTSGHRSPLGSLRLSGLRFPHPAVARDLHPNAYRFVFGSTYRLHWYHTLPLNVESKYPLIVEAKQLSQRRVIGWLTKIYYFELDRASEGTLSRRSRLHLQSFVPTPVSRRVDVRQAAGRTNSCRIFITTRRKYVVPTPLSGIRVGKREIYSYIWDGYRGAYIWQLNLQVL
jgi:hypothetical protein